MRRTDEVVTPVTPVTARRTDEAGGGGDDLAAHERILSQERMHRVCNVGVTYVTLE